MIDNNSFGGYGKSYFPNAAGDASGFKFRVDGKDVVQELVDALKGGVSRDNTGRIAYNEEYRLMNDLGVSRAQFYLKGVVNKNTHLSKFKDEERILRQVRALAKEWCVTLAQNRRRWDVKDPDVVQQLMEQSILTALLRADEGFEAQLSGKSHNVIENIQSTPQGPEQQHSGFLGLGRIFGRG